MQKRISAFALAIMAIAMILNLSACGGGGGTVTVSALALSPTSATVQLGEPANFSLTVTFTNPSDATSTTPVLTYLVNGIAGGSAITGVIAASSTDAQVAIYTAPATAPNSDNNIVTITATTPAVPGSTTNTNIVTSNSVQVTLGPGEGLTVNPTTATVPAGGTFQFNAVFNNQNDTSVNWSVASTGGGNVGTINPATGLYTAPPFPPPGGTVTVSATQGTITAMAVATIAYSDASLTGPFSFSYSGNDKSGFLAAAGSFQADGLGHIVSGVQDQDSFSTGPSVLPIPISGIYTVDTDGRGTISLNSGPGQGTVNTLQFVLSTNQHGLLTRFDSNFTGSGTLDQQNLDALANSPSVVSGPYVFRVAGADASFHPLGIAGRFTSGGTGAILNAGSIQDVNDNGTIKSSDTTLAGTYGLDQLHVGSGRGTITLTSTSGGTITYAFYVVDSTRLRLVEIDSTAFLAGDAFTGEVGGSFSPATLAKGNYPFTDGGNSSMGLYSAGGIFTSDGAGNITGGVFDSNNNGTVTATGGVTLGTCTYTVSPATGRIDLRLQLATGACPGTDSPTTAEYVAYPTAKNSVLMLEIDSNAVAGGSAFLQVATPATFTGNISFRLGSQGLVHNSLGSIQGNATGQLVTSGTAASSGFMDINNFNLVSLKDPINIATTTFAAPSALGRGTGVISGTNPNVTFNVDYYVIDADTALLFDSDTTRNMTGIILQQF